MPFRGLRDANTDSFYTAAAAVTRSRIGTKRGTKRGKTQAGGKNPQLKDNPDQLSCGISSNGAN
jgi:hypothetical protein